MVKKIGKLKSPKLVKIRRPKSRPDRPAWFARLVVVLARQRAVWAVLAALVAMGALTVGAAVGLRRLHEYVLAQRAYVASRCEVVLVDQPAWMGLGLAEQIRAELLDVREGRNWTFDETLARRVHEAAVRCPWVRQLQEVRVERAKGEDGTYSAGRVMVKAQWRQPVAIAQYRKQDSTQQYVDAEGCVLPRHQIDLTNYPVICGLASPAPTQVGQAGRAPLWSGEDLQAGLALLKALSRKPYYGQFRAVDVSNYGQWVNNLAAEIDLIVEATEPDGTVRQTRYHWGQFPLDGPTVDESKIPRKILYLDTWYRENHDRLTATQPIDLRREEGLALVAQ